MATKNKITDLRNHLFETLEALKDEDKPMEVQRAKAIADVAKAIIDSAKVEVAYLKTTGGALGTGFIPEEQEAPTDRRLPPHRPGRNGSAS